MLHSNYVDDLANDYINETGKHKDTNNSHIVSSEIHNCETLSCDTSRYDETLTHQSSNLECHQNDQSQPTDEYSDLLKQYNRICQKKNNSTSTENNLNFEFQKYNILNKTDEFTYKTNNTIITLTLLNSLFTLFYYEINKYNLSFFVLNVIIFIYYNYLNIDVVTKVITHNNITNIYKSLYDNTFDFLHLIKQKLNGVSRYFFDYFFSKNTQIVLKIIYNMSKMRVINTYKLYKNKLFNPLLLTQTAKENVYVVSFYLNDVTYKIPIVEPRFIYGTKQQPLLILNKNEEDVTQNILQYMGPNNDFFGMMLKPKHLNEKTLNFIMEDGTEININENDVIVF